MCGIVGYLGHNACSNILLGGLRKLEYRGYDSAGLAMVTPDGFRLVRRSGKLDQLVQAVTTQSVDGSCGMGHTRWATHGEPTEENAHPHVAGRVAVVHNGIIENYAGLRRQLQAKGREFTSQTDTEVIAHLVDVALDDTDDLHAAVRAALRELRGAWAIVVMRTDGEREMVIARSGSPLVVGLGEDEVVVASDVPAFLDRTRSFIFLEDHDTARVTPTGIEVYDRTGEAVTRKPTLVEWDPGAAERGGWPHFLIKEIHEQPAALLNTLGGRIRWGRATFEDEGVGRDFFRDVERIVMVGCGSAHYASRVAQTFLRRWTRIPVECELASEFRYADPVVNERTLVIAVSQSGETADTLAAVRQARHEGARCLAVCNVVGSTIARESDGVIFTKSGPEISVASTKAFTGQVLALLLAGIAVEQEGDVFDDLEREKTLAQLAFAPQAVATALETEAAVREAAKKLAAANSCLYLGRGANAWVAAEGALKLKEITYIHAEGYAAGEMKHGPIALIEPGYPVVVLVDNDHLVEKVASNVAEVQARGATVIAIGEGPALEKLGPDVHRIETPPTPVAVRPLVMTVVTQLLAYHVADEMGLDMDQPRNLAKSVTVE